MKRERTVEAFILMKREALNQETGPQSGIRYDEMLQIWVNEETGKSIVLQSLEESIKLDSSDFGETIITRTQEGADQSEVLGSSEFGETLMTETREGVDQAEIIGFTEFGETRMTATREGIDQAEIYSDPREDSE